MQFIKQAQQIQQCSNALGDDVPKAINYATFRYVLVMQSLLELEGINIICFYEKVKLVNPSYSIVSISPIIYYVTIIAGISKTTQSTSGNFGCSTA